MGALTRDTLGLLGEHRYADGDWDTSDWECHSDVGLSIQTTDSNNKLRFGGSPDFGSPYWYVIREKNIGSLSEGLIWLKAQVESFGVPQGDNNMFGVACHLPASIDSTAGTQDGTSLATTVEKTTGTEVFKIREHTDGGSSGVSAEANPAVRSKLVDYPMSLYFDGADCAGYDHTDSLSVSGTSSYSSGHVGLVYQSDKHQCLAADMVIMSGRYVTVTGLGSGNKAKVRDSGGAVLAEATEASGVALVDMLSVSIPDAYDLVVTDASDTVLATEVPSDGLYGGDEYSYLGPAGQITWAALEILDREVVKPIVIALMDDLPCDGGETVYRIPDMVRASVTRDADGRHELILAGPTASDWTAELRRGRVLHTRLHNEDRYEWIINTVEDGVGGGKEPATVVIADPVESVLTDCGPVRTVTSGGTTSYIVAWENQTCTQIIDNIVIPALQDYGITYISRGTVDPTVTLTGSAELVTPAEVMKTLAGVTGAYWRLRRNSTTGYYLDLVDDLSDSAATARVRSGVNLLDLARTRSGEDIATAVVVRGADVEGFRPPVGMAAWEVDTIAADGANWRVTLTDPEGGAGPIAIDDQFVSNGLGSSDPKNIPTHYLRFTDGTMEAILDSETEGDVILADVTGLSAGDKVYISPDSSGTLLTEVHSPTGLDLYGRVCRYFDLDNTIVRDNESSNALCNTWTTQPENIGALLDGDQTLAGPMDIEGAPPGKEIKTGDVLRVASWTSHIYYLVDADVTVDSDGRASVSITSGSTTQLYDQMAVLIYDRSSLPDSWEEGTESPVDREALFARRPSDQSGSLRGTVAANYNIPHYGASGATIQHAFKVGGLTSGDRIYTGDRVEVASAGYHAQHDATADGSGEALVVVGADAVGYPTIGDTVHITRSTPTFEDGQDAVLTLVPKVISDSSSVEAPTILTPDSLVRYIEGDATLWASVKFHVYNPSDDSITVEAGGQIRTPKIDLWDGSSLASARAGSFSLAAGEEREFVLRAGADITATDNYRIRITPVVNENPATATTEYHHEPTVSVIWAELSLSLEEPDTEELTSGASARLLHQAANRELVRSHLWPSSLEVTHRELVEYWGADPEEPKLTLGQTVRITETTLGIDTEMTVDRVRWRLEDAYNPTYVLGRAQKDYTERVVEAIGGGAGSLSAVVTSSTGGVGGGTSVDEYTNAEIDNMLLHGFGVDYDDKDGNEEPLSTRVIVLVRDGVAQALPTLGDSVIFQDKDGTRTDLTLISLT